jgi:hypothetical protein
MLKHDMECKAIAAIWQTNNPLATPITINTMFPSLSFKKWITMAYTRFFHLKNKIRTIFDNQILFDNF